jgi:hypothetical protein
MITSTDTSNYRTIFINNKKEVGKDINIFCKGDQPDYILRYELNIVSSDMNESFESDDGNFTFSENNIGEYNATCKVINEYDKMDEYKISFKITPPNQLPIAKFDANTTGGVSPLSVEFTSKSGNISDTDGYVLSSKIDCGNGIVQDYYDDWGTYQTTCTYKNEGDYNATLVVEDNEHGITKKVIHISVVPKSILTLKEEYNNDYTLNDIETDGKTIAITDTRGTSLYSVNTLPALSKDVFFNPELDGSGIVLNDPDNYLADSYYYSSYSPGSRFLKSKIVGSAIYQMVNNGVLCANIDNISAPTFNKMYFSDYGWARDMVKVDSSKILVAENYHYQQALVLKDISNTKTLDVKGLKCSKLLKVSNHILGLCSNKLLDVNITGNTFTYVDITNNIDNNISQINDIDAFDNSLAVLYSKVVGQAYGEFGETIDVSKTYINLLDVSNNFKQLSIGQASSGITKLDYVNKNFIVGFNENKLSTYKVINNNISNSGNYNYGATDLIVIGNKIITIKNNTIDVYEYK